MRRYTPPGSGDLSAIKSDGALATVDPGNGCTLSAGTWYFPFGDVDASLPGETPLVGLQLQWAALVAGVFTFETTSFPKYVNDVRVQGKIDVDDNDGNATRTNWVQQNPSSLYVPTPTGSGNSASGLVITAGGTNFGGTAIDIGNLGARRGRLKAVLAVGGLVRVALNGKAGG